MNKIFKMLIIITSFFTITACKNVKNLKIPTEISKMKKSLETRDTKVESLLTQFQYKTYKKQCKVYFSLIKV